MSCSPAARSSSRRRGNTGVGLAIVAQRKGYQCVFVCPDKVERGQAQRAAGVRRRGRGVPDRGRARTTPTPTTASPTGWSGEIAGAWKPNQYANPHNPRVALLRRPGPELWEQTDGPDHALRRGHRHRRHDQRHRPLPQGGVRRAGPGDRRRPGGLGVLRRHRAALPRRGRRRGLLAHHLRQGHLRRDRRGLRRRLVRDDPAARARGGAAGRRLVRDGDGRGAAGGGRAARAGRRGRRAAARRRPRLPRQDLQRRVDGRLRLPAARDRAPRSATCCAARTARSPRSCTCTPTRPSPTPSALPARVRRLADAGRAGRAAGDGGRGRRARSSSATCSTRCSPAARSCRTGSSEHMSPPLPTIGANEPLDTAMSRVRRRPTPRWCWSTASPRAS